MSKPACVCEQGHGFATLSLRMPFETGLLLFATLAGLGASLGFSFSASHLAIETEVLQLCVTVFDAV